MTDAGRDAEIRARLAELEEERSVLRAELRRLGVIESLEPLDLAEEQRRDLALERLEEIRGETEELAGRRRASAHERKMAARAAEEGRRLRAHDARERERAERALQEAIIRERQEQIGPYVGISAGGQPPGHPLIVRRANMVEEMIAEAFDGRALELLGARAFCVRNLADDREWGIRIVPGGGGKIEAGQPPAPDAPVRSPTEARPQDPTQPPDLGASPRPVRTR